MENQTVTVNLKEKKAQESAKNVLRDLGWEEGPSRNEYVVWRMENPENVAMLYTSGKLVIQGSSAREIAGKFETAPEEFIPHIGSDEVGKGDYFGPLVVCAAYVDKGDVERIVELGVTDSKKLTDIRIEQIGEKLKEFLLYEAIVVSPSDYNQMFSEVGNVSLLLAGKHAEAVSKLYERVIGEGRECSFVVFDQFSKRKSRLDDAMKSVEGLKVMQFHKGESDVAVAAGSVMARYYFLKYWSDMELKYGFAFPKGASEVIDAGKEFVAKFGQEHLSEVAKVSFKTTKKVLTLF
jgi:ribonuclease HIII